MQDQRKTSRLRFTVRPGSGGGSLRATRCTREAARSLCAGASATGPAARSSAHPDLLRHGAGTVDSNCRALRNEKKGDKKSRECYFHESPKLAPFGPPTQTFTVHTRLKHNAPVHVLVSSDDDAATAPWAHERTKSRVPMYLLKKGTGGRRGESQ